MDFCSWHSLEVPFVCLLCARNKRHPNSGATLCRLCRYFSVVLLVSAPWPYMHIPHGGTDPRSPLTVAFPT